MYLILLQTEPQVLGNITESVSNGLTVAQVILISLGTYFLGLFAQYAVSLLLKRADVKNDRKMKIAELSIANEVNTYKLLIQLRGYQNGDSALLLSAIENLNIILNNDKLLFSSKFHKAAEDIVEYFSVVCGDFTKKDIQKEKKLFDILYSSFQG